MVRRLSVGQQADALSGEVLSPFESLIHGADEDMSDLLTPVVGLGERQFTRLCQVTVTDDQEIARVNQLLAEGWQLVDIGYRSDATVYVLGRQEDKPRHKTGFLGAQ